MIHLGTYHGRKCLVEARGGDNVTVLQHGTEPQVVPPDADGLVFPCEADPERDASDYYAAMRSRRCPCCREIGECRCMGPLCDECNGCSFICCGCREVAA